MSLVTIKKEQKPTKYMIKLSSTTDGVYTKYFNTLSEIEKCKAEYPGFKCTIFNHVNGSIYSNREAI